MHMHFILALTVMVMLTGCVSTRSTEATRAETVARVEARADTTSDGTSTARTLSSYKEEIARRIAETNSTQVYIERPQALLRAVVVVRFVVDGSGKLLRSEIVRSNHDSVTDNTALTTLRNTAPFPKPAAALLSNGHVELSETWLFNDDGRFQIRTIAKAQMGE